MTIPMPGRAGWYRDPHHDRLARWWDGTGWSTTVRPLPAVEAAPSVTRPEVTSRKLSVDATRALVIVVLAVMVYGVWGYSAVVEKNSIPAVVSESASTP